MLKRCTELFPRRYDWSDGATKPAIFWSDIHRSLEYLHGSPIPTSPTAVDEGVIDFFCRCRDEHFLDFVEMIFKSNEIFKPDAGIDVQKLIMEVNRFLEEDNLPYFLTGFVFPPRPPKPPNAVVYGIDPLDAPPPRIVAYPQIIRKENEVLHQQAIEPMLLLLTEPHFASANEEIVEALKHYRKGEYRDCVLKCGSSFESVMKVICDRKRWPFQQTDTAGKLLKTILLQTTLDSFYEQPIMLIATIRNRYSTAHGAGTQEKTVSKHVANYVINATASAILLLVDETSP